MGRRKRKTEKISFDVIVANGVEDDYKEFKNPARGIKEFLEGDWDGITIWGEREEKGISYIAQLTVNMDFHEYECFMEYWGQAQYTYRDRYVYLEQRVKKLEEAGKLLVKGLAKMKNDLEKLPSFLPSDIKLYRTTWTKRGERTGRRSFILLDDAYNEFVRQIKRHYADEITLRFVLSKTPRGLEDMHLKKPYAVISLSYAPENGIGKDSFEEVIIGRVIVYTWDEWNIRRHVLHEKKIREMNEKKIKELVLNEISEGAKILKTLRSRSFFSNTFYVALLPFSSLYIPRLLECPSLFAFSRLTKTTAFISLAKRLYFDKTLFT